MRKVGREQRGRKKEREKGERKRRRKGREGEKRKERGEREGMKKGGKGDKSRCLLIPPHLTFCLRVDSISNNLNYIWSIALNKICALQV